VRALLITHGASGGERVYSSRLRANPPEGVAYAVSDEVHRGAPGAHCLVPLEIALNRTVRPFTVPDSGFRVLRLGERFDLVHVHAHPVRLLGLRGAPVLMSEGSSTAVYLAEYLGWDDDRLASRFRRARRIYRALGVRDRLLALDRVAAAYVFSDWARDVNVRWGADPDKLGVIPPGFPVPTDVSPDERETFTFLFVGKDFERKGGFDLIEAFELVSEDHPDARLVLIGSDPWARNPDRLIHAWVGDPRRARVLERLEWLEREGSVIRHGELEPHVVRASHFPTADAFVMPTLAEGFGFTNVEAMSFGLPVISSRVGPIPEIVRHGETGLLAAPGDVSSLAESMSRLIGDRAAARRMGANGRTAFLREFTIDHQRRRLGALYDRVLGAS
jgi:glycosyltransferase involved in cell wall biosynthesis